MKTSSRFGSRTLTACVTDFYAGKDLVAALVWDREGPDEDEGMVPVHTDLDRSSSGNKDKTVSLLTNHRHRLPLARVINFIFLD